MSVMLSNILSLLSETEEIRSARFPESLKCVEQGEIS